MLHDQPSNHQPANPQMQPVVSLPRGGRERRTVAGIEAQFIANPGAYICGVDRMLLLLDSPCKILIPFLALYLIAIYESLDYHFPEIIPRLEGLRRHQTLYRDYMTIKMIEHVGTLVGVLAGSRVMYGSILHPDGHIVNIFHEQLLDWFNVGWSTWYNLGRAFADCRTAYELLENVQAVGQPLIGDERETWESLQVLHDLRHDSPLFPPFNDPARYGRLAREIRVVEFKSRPFCNKVKQIIVNRAQS